MSEAIKTTIKIKQVQNKPPWQKPNTEQYWYTVVAEGDGEPLSFIQDRDKEAPTPVPGKTYKGNLYEEETGKRKFYPFKLEDASKPSTGYQKSPEDRDSIYRCNALNNAVAIVAAGTKDNDNTLEIADKFYAWLKGETSPKEEAPSTNTTTGADSAMSGYAKSKAIAEKLKKPSIGSEEEDDGGASELEWIRNEE